MERDALAKKMCYALHAHEANDVNSAGLWRHSGVVTQHIEYWVLGQERGGGGDNKFSCDDGL